MVCEVSKNKTKQTEKCEKPGKEPNLFVFIRHNRLLFLIEGNIQTQVYLGLFL